MRHLTQGDYKMLIKLDEYNPEKMFMGRGRNAKVASVVKSQDDLVADLRKIVEKYFENTEDMLDIFTQLGRYGSQNSHLYELEKYEKSPGSMQHDALMIYDYLIGDFVRQAVPQMIKIVKSPEIIDIVNPRSWKAYSLKGLEKIKNKIIPEIIKIMADDKGLRSTLTHFNVLNQLMVRMLSFVITMEDSWDKNGAVIDKYGNEV